MRRVFQCTLLIVALLLWVCTCKLRAEERPMKLLVVPKESGGRLALVFPFRSESGTKYTIKWRKQGSSEWKEAKGDGPIVQPVTENGKYEVEVGPANVEGVKYSEYPTEAQQTLLEIQAWGSIKWKDVIIAFKDCKNMQLTAQDKPDLSGVTSCNGMFWGCEKLDSENLRDWNVSHITGLTRMFLDCKNFNQPLNWDVRNVREMAQIFDGAKKFNQSLSNWTLSSCQNISLDGAGISDENYQKTLRAWARNPQTGKNTTVSAKGLAYGNAKSDRNTLIQAKGWKFEGDYEALGNPSGTNPFIFEIETGETTHIELPISGTSWNFTYAKAGSTPQKVENAGNKPIISVEKNTEYQIKVAPKGVAWCSFQNTRNFSLKRIRQFGDVKWASVEDFLSYNSHVTIESGASAPDLSLPANCTAMLKGTSNIEGLDPSKWDVRKVENLEAVLERSNLDFDISQWKLYACKKIGLADSKLSKENYDKALKAWAEDSQTAHNVELDATNLIYTEAAIAHRNKLINEKKWSIKGDNLPYYLEFENSEVNPIPTHCYNGQKISLRTKTGGLTEAEKNALKTTLPTVEPADAADVALEYGGYKIVFKKIGTVRITLSVPKLEGVHAELRAEQSFEIKPTPTLKFYVNDKLVNGNEFTVPVESTPTLMVKTEPESDLTFAWAINPSVSTTGGGTYTNIITPLEAKDYTVTATCYAIPTLKASFTLKAKAISTVMIEGKKKIALYLNGTDAEKKHQIVAKVLPSSAPQDLKFEIEGTNDGSFTIDAATGIVTAQKRGKGKVKVSSKTDATATPDYCEIFVTKVIKNLDIVSDDTHPIVDHTIQVDKGSSVTLSVQFDPEDLDESDKNITWELPANSGITKEELPNGKTVFTCTKKGDYVITTVSTVRQDVSESVTLRVTNDLKSFDIMSNGMKLNDQEIQLKKGDSRMLTYDMVPADADPRNDIVWESDAPTKVSIATTGALLVEDGAQPGDVVVISVTTTNKPIIKTSFMVKVVEQVIEATGVTTEPKGSLSMKVGDKQKFSATVTPAGASQTVQWIAMPKGKLIFAADGTAQAIAAGSVTVKAVTTNNIESDPINITIEAKPELTGIAFVNPAKEVKVGTTEVFTVQFTPNDGINKELDVTLEPKGFLSLVSVVDGKITVKGEKESEQEITITAKSKAKPDLAPATCKVKVTKGTPVEDALFAGIVVAPNPFVDVLRISMESVSGLTYTLYSTQGNVVLHGELTNTTSEINTTSVPSGLYLLRIATKDGASKTWRILKN
ncbi:MAG: BspA family leucine-rich repeat surface protein [Bacteroides sp.]